MEIKMLLLLVGVIITYNYGYVDAALSDRPKITARGGHLSFVAAPGKNISLTTSGRGGAVAVNGLDIATTFSLLHTVRPQLEILQTSSLTYLLANLSTVAREVSSETRLSENLAILRTNITQHKSRLDSMKSRIDAGEKLVEPLVERFEDISSVLGDDAPEKLRNITNWMNSMSSQSNSGGASSLTIQRIQSRVTQVESSISNLGNYESRIESLELAYGSTNGSTGGSSSSSLSRRATRKVQRISRRVRSLESNLRRKECNSLPCEHGGTCIDGYLSYQCLCRDGWTGATCSDDVDECMEYQGTDLGCQNGGTCVNIVGGFRCTCPTGFTGRHCTLRDANAGCNSAGAASLCDHGDCIPGANGNSYSCRCHQGWTKISGSELCSQDINECESGRLNHCSANPPVQCVNTPGSYVCGGCPAGYTGDGFRCSDVNECLIFNGGCSMMPRVQCINSFGSHQCGPCPPGYTGDGVTCILAPRPCLSSPCHVMAQCIDTLHNMMPNYYQCQCPSGYAGNGIGPYGCSPAQGGNTNTGGGGSGSYNPCSSNPCVHGTCQANGNSFNCICTSGYSGTVCDQTTDPCAINPCQGGGNCTASLPGSGSRYTCTCPRYRTGTNCEQYIPRCSGDLTGTGGVVEYPPPGLQVTRHNYSCSWTITANSSKVVNITFSEFSLRSGSGCLNEFLVIRDGRNWEYPQLGRFCGSTLPGINGTLVGTHNALRLFFYTRNHLGSSRFKFTWTAQDPDCGGVIRGQDHGSINSPGYPNNYPHSRNCSWTVRVRHGKRILFHFATVAIESHPNCSFDKLEVKDGVSPTSPLLGRFCSSQTPAPITTSGSEAVINFHTDMSHSDTGFHISFSTVPGFPGCGGVLTGDMGHITSPELNDQYHHNLLCEWEIRVPEGETIDLNFTAFSLENSYGSSCYFDHVEIRDGDSIDSPLIGRYCGGQMPPTVRSSSNRLLVVFKTDGSVATSGFDAVYQVACGGEFLGPTGLIRSPYHPDPYPHDRECQYVIKQPVGKAIILNFTSFDIEHSTWTTNCLFDYVEIRDGSSGRFPLLGHFCGPPDNTPAPITSSMNYMWLKFKTDASVANNGFEANWTTIDISCGGVMRDIFGVISSPNSPDTYHANSDCMWVIEGYPGSVVELTWSLFVLESHSNCIFDYIEVFDNSTHSQDSPHMGGGRLCGSTAPPPMTSLGNVVTIHFHSDSSVNHDGFTINYRLINSTTECGGKYHTESGVITSPLYPNQYPASRVCEWVITVPIRRQIALNFETFDMARSWFRGCNGGDYLEIRNGGQSTSPLISKLCGTNVTVPEIFSHSHNLYLKLVTNRYRSGRGFKANWSSAATGCGGTLTSVTGELISPGYPQQYYHRADCYWKIRVNKGSKVTLHVVDIEMEDSNSYSRCVYDYMEVSDPVTSEVLGRYCSSQQMITVTGTSNELNVRFRSNSGSSGRGFKARYNADCHNVLEGPRGVIESPNYPENYPHASNCSWTIKATRGNSIAIAFSHFKLENISHAAAEICHFDYLELRVGSRGDSARTTAGHFCGIRLPQPVSSGEGMDVMEVVFITDGSVADNGFRAEWHVVGCGGMYTKESGSFTSPNYPNTYPANRDCEWHVQTDPGTRIKITIHGFDIEAPIHTNECVFDSLKVYGGPDETAPVLTNLCHKQSHDVVLTTGSNTALLVMKSDSSVRGNGFNISYETLPGGCGGLVTTPQGKIHSPNYPNNYNDDLDCVWTITVNPLHIVKFTFEDFVVEHSVNCTYDYFSLYDGDSIDASEILRHCGDSMPEPATWRSSGNSLTVRINSDTSVGSKGFIANYTTGCGARIPVSQGDVGFLQSPNYPDVFVAELNCTWHLEANEGERIRLVFNHLDIRSTVPFFNTNDSCVTDFVAVHDGDDIDSPEVNKFCGSTSPPTVYSSSRYLTVRMVIFWGHGVGFRATYSDVSTACGGDLFSESGQFASPFFPENYRPGYDCVWNIRAGAGNRVELTFSQFDLVESDHCNTDYVEVHQGSASGPLLLHNCSNVVPETITADDSLWIRFKTGENSIAPGFIASYNLVHGNDITASSGNIVSPMYPATYHGAGEFTWRIYSPNRVYIAVTVEEMSIEMDSVQDVCLSSLKIYAYNSDYHSMLANLCGYEAPTRTFVSRGTSMLIKFTSDNRFEGSRFKLRFEEVSDRNYSRIETYESGSVVEESSCRQHIMLNTSMTVTSPNYPENYNASLDCEWILQTLPHERMRFYISFELEESYTCSLDRLDVFNGIEGKPNWNRTHSVCKREHSPVYFYSDGQFAKLHFVTDSSVQKRGFRAYITPVCGGYLHGPEGVIKTEGYPYSNYPSYQNCIWTIRVRTGKTIKLHFDSFRLVNTSDSCEGDNLIIRNGGTASSPYLGSGRYCGYSRPGDLVSSSNVVILQFQSDNIDSSRGFHITYYEMSDQCGGSHILSSNMPEFSFTTPNFPNLVHPHTECSWIISVPHDETVQIEFEDNFEIPTTFDGSCDQAWVELRDGGTEFAPLITTLCGNNIPNTVQSKDSIIFVRYYGNVTDAHKGFKAKASIGSCGGTIRFANFGVITSPGYPQNYPPNTNCTWILEAPPGHYISLHFLDFEVFSNSQNCSGETGFLRFTESSGIAGNDTMLGSHCGRFIPAPFDSSSNQVTVTYKSGTNPLNWKGFSLMFNSSREVCGGDISGTSGEITSPGYPHGYSHSRNCEWRIQAPVGKRIALTFVDVDLNTYNSGRGRAGRVYCRDAIMMRNGIDRRAPRLNYYSEICGSRVNGKIFNSSMNSMILNFYTRGHSNNRGFKATWTAYEEQECGGRLLGSSGSFSSPGLESGGYNHSLNCLYTLDNENHRTSAIKLNVGHLDLERRCFDYILIQGELDGEIFDLKQICQENQNTEYVFSYPRLRISFITDMSVNHTGFNMSYSMDSCGGYLTGPNDIITSPNYPSNYDNNVHCSWLLKYEPDSQIEFEFTNFQLENSIRRDYVSIINGRSETSMELGRYTGTTLPTSVGNSMSNIAVVHFKTDGSNNRQGFRLVTQQHNSGCGGVYHSERGNVSTLGFPNSSYANNIECTWQIQARPGYQLLVTFVDIFDIETSMNCENDFVQVSYGRISRGVEGENRRLVWQDNPKKCGKQNPGSSLTPSPHAKILFRTNEAIQGNGFKVHWESECGGEYAEEEGVITSPLHPGRYPRSTNCTYKIIAKPGAFVSLNFLNFTFEGSMPVCSFDYILVETSSINRNNNQRQKYCGRSELPPSVTTQGNITIKFVSDGSIQYSGFMANYTSKLCGGILDQPGVISLPMSTNYHNNMNCLWNITAPAGKTITFKFLSLNVERHTDCRYDSVNIYEGLKTAEGEHLLGKFCGDHDISTPYMATVGNTASVEFIADHIITAAGFSLAVEFRTACGEVVNITGSSFTKTIHSMDADNDGLYDPNLHCKWVFVAPEDQVVAINFTRFEIEAQPANDSRICPYDFIQILDGSGSMNSSEIYKGCGSSKPTGGVVSSSNIMELIFHSDSVNQTAGFTAIVTSRAHPCGSSNLHVTSTPQILSTPNYPQNYPTSIRCRWNLMAPENETILLQFDDFNLEHSTSCTKDKLVIQQYFGLSEDHRIYGGNGRTRYYTEIGGRRFTYVRPGLDDYVSCGDVSPGRHPVNNQNAVLRFNSDDAVVGHGFRLHYSIQGCNTTYMNPFGAIQFSMKTQEYRCTVRVSAPEGKYITLYFSYISISNSDTSTCEGSNLKVYEGHSTSVEEAVTACHYSEPDPYYSTGNEVTIELTANNNRYNYATINYAVSDQPNGCGGSLYGREGKLTSPNYPSPAADNSDCVYTLEVNAPYHVALSFANWATEFGGGGCNSTYLDIYDVNPDGSNELVTRVCGDERVANHVSLHNRLLLRYVTGTNVTGMGWMVTMHQGMIHPEDAPTV